MYTLRHKKSKALLCKDGGWTIDIDKVQWFDAWVSVAEIELKRPEAKAVSSIDIIKELQEELRDFVADYKQPQSSMYEPVEEVKSWEK